MPVALAAPQPSPTCACCQGPARVRALQEDHPATPTTRLVQGLLFDFTWGGSTKKSQAQECGLFMCLIFLKSLWLLWPISWCNSPVKNDPTVTGILLLGRTITLWNQLWRPEGSKEWKTLDVKCIPELKKVPCTPHVKLVNNPFKNLIQLYLGLTQQYIHWTIRSDSI